jgi:hypothetical protein
MRCLERIELIRSLTWRGPTRSSTTYGPRSLQDELVGLMSAASQRLWVKVPWWIRSPAQSVNPWWSLPTLSGLG